MAIPTINVGNFLRLRLFCQEDAQGSVNTLDYTAQNVVGLVSVATLAGQIGAVLPALVKNTLNENAQYRGFTLQLQQGGVVYVQVANTTGFGPGLTGRFSMPKQVCGLITKRTSVAGPGFRGRVYMPFPYTSDTVSSGVMSPAQLAQYTAFADQMLKDAVYVSGANNITLRPIIRHKNPATPPEEVTSYTIAGLWATQQRRGDYGQANTGSL